MKFGPIETIDKLGRTVVLRNAEVSDAEDLIRFLRITSEETPYLLREPEEICLTRKQEECFIQSRIDSPRELMLVATIDQVHVGNCSLMGIGPFQRYQHRCEVAIALYQEFWGAGIGRLLLEALLRAAKDAGYEQAELEVVSTNLAARTLYQKLGFAQYGHFPNRMKYRDGSYADTDWMMKKL